MHTLFCFILIIINKYDELVMILVKNNMKRTVLRESLLFVTFLCFGENLENLNDTEIRSFEVRCEGRELLIGGRRLLYYFSGASF